MDPTLMTHVLLSLALWTSPAAPTRLPVWDSLTSAEAVLLRALDDGALDDQRAGALEDTAALSDAERAALEASQSSAPELQSQRGGDIHVTDREMKIILWTTVVVAILFVVL